MHHQSFLDNESFSITTTPPRRTLLRITQVLWSMALLAAAMFVLIGYAKDPPEVLLRKTLSLYLGAATLASLNAVISLVERVVYTVAPLSLFLGMPIGLVTLIVALRSNDANSGGCTLTVPTADVPSRGSRSWNIAALAASVVAGISIALAIFSNVAPFYMVGGTLALIIGLCALRRSNATGPRVSVPVTLALVIGGPGTLIGIAGLMQWLMRMGRPG